MGKVTTPVAVDPDHKLFRHSSEMGWKIITLR
jgi:phosphoserine phosphatase